jgi:hypothetical protein
MILPHSFNDSYLGMKVLVYWPADHQWWAATICQVLQPLTSSALRS